MRAWRTIGVALVALTAAALPASAMGQAAEDEYSLNIPGASGGDNPGNATSSGAVEPGAGGKAPDSTTSATEPGKGVEGSAGTGDVAGAGGSAGGNGNGGDQKTAAPDAGEGGGANARSSPGVAQSSPTLTSAPTDEGGAPTALIVLAVIAALGTAVAIWRMRKRDDERDGVGLGSGPAAATGETQSL
jgi:hypothetical protein